MTAQMNDGFTFKNRLIAWDTHVFYMTWRIYTVPWLSICSTCPKSTRTEWEFIMQAMILHECQWRGANDRLWHALQSWRKWEALVQDFHVPSQPCTTSKNAIQVTVSLRCSRSALTAHGNGACFIDAKRIEVKLIAASRIPDFFDCHAPWERI